MSMSRLLFRHQRRLQQTPTETHYMLETIGILKGFLKERENESSRKPDQRSNVVISDKYLTE